MAKLWKGRFSKELDSRVNDFNSSVSFDSAMYREDITGSIAHVSMLGRQGIIAADDAKKIASELAAILDDIDEGKLTIDPEAEDIHMFVEARFDVHKAAHRALAQRSGRGRSAHVSAQAHR